MYNEKASCVCLHVHTNLCTQKQIKAQSSIFKMLFTVVILLLPEALGSLGLIHENACRDPHLSNPLCLFSVFLLGVMCCFLSPCSGSLCVPQRSSKVGKL